MTIDEAIIRADRLRPNPYTREEKIGWLSALDGMIVEEVLKIHQGALENFSGYGPEVDGGTVLLAQAPYDEDLYPAYLESRMDRESGETARYNVSASLFNGAYLTYLDWYNRTHTPVRKVEKFIL